MNRPATDRMRTHVRSPAAFTAGLDRVAHGVLGRFARAGRHARSLRARAEQAHAAAARLETASQADLDARLAAYRDAFRRQDRNRKPDVVGGLAAIAEVARRTLGLRPHVVQLMGALGLQQGAMLEMATGEGKSLTTSLGAALAAWTGRPCHVMTVNDYLAARDAEEHRAFYAGCGLTAASVVAGLEPAGRREAYAAGVVYTTSHQLLADFLRDRLQLGAMANAGRRLIRRMLERREIDGAGLVLRGLDTALVDEADSVLIDEAVTPLIISTPAENQPLVEASRHAVAIARELARGPDYELDLRYRDVRLTDAGRAKVEAAAADLGGLWAGAPRRVELVTQALRARELHRRDHQYVVQDGKVVIVDEFTGRLMPDRTWSHGLHQAVEALESVDVTSPTETLARLSFQRFFRLFRRLAGMTGTGAEAAAELWHIYELPVIPIPTHRPCLRVQRPDAVHATEAASRAAAVDEIAREHARGRPVLVGTRSVKASEELAALLTARKLDFALLNATRHREEAAIVAGAGAAGRITIATNMAGRGTDIKLGPGVAEAGGLHVIACERNESGRVDRQLFGRSARQGDPGSARAFVSPEDELMRRFVSAPVRAALSLALRAHVPGAGLATQLALSRAQAAAQALAYRQRRQVLELDEWLEEALSFTERERKF